MKAGNANVEINGAALRELRKLAGFSITALAEKVGCSFQYLSQLETEPERACSPALYAKICKALRLTDRTVLLRQAPVHASGDAA